MNSNPPARGYPWCGAALIGDQFSPAAAHVFDGVHTYNRAGALRRAVETDTIEPWARRSYRQAVDIARWAHCIGTISVIPGYDDAKIRTLGLAIDRLDSRLYQIHWEQAIAADPDWVLITSFNEWHEGGNGPSGEYIDLTGLARPTHQSRCGGKRWTVAL